MCVLLSLDAPRPVSLLRVCACAQGGEDLRLDQRIQQLFGIMNGVFKATPATTQRGLSVGTYSVVPMTSRVGMIEWVGNTLPIKVAAWWTGLPTWFVWLTSRVLLVLCAGACVDVCWLLSFCDTELLLGTLILIKPSATLS